jgi:hypothetical protein
MARGDLRELQVPRCSFSGCGFVLDLLHRALGGFLDEVVTGPRSPRRASSRGPCRAHIGRVDAPGRTSSAALWMRSKMAATSSSESSRPAACVSLPMHFSNAIR